MEMCLTISKNEWRSSSLQISNAFDINAYGSRVPCQRLWAWSTDRKARRWSVHSLVKGSSFTL